MAGQVAGTETCVGSEKICHILAAYNWLGYRLTDGAVRKVGDLLGRAKEAKKTCFVPCLPGTAMIISASADEARFRAAALVATVMKFGSGPRPSSARTITEADVDRAEGFILGSDVGGRFTAYRVELAEKRFFRGRDKSRAGLIHFDLF